VIKVLQTNKFVYFFPALLFIANIISKGWFLTAQEISHDEPFSIYHAQFNVTTIIDQLKGYNNPPLYEVLLHFWIKIFGISPVSVRALPLLFASLAPVALYFFGKKYFTLRVAIISSVLLSCSNLVTYHAHDCRVYTLFLLLSILSMHFFLEVLIGQLPKLQSKSLFVLSSTLLIYAHYFGFFILFIQALYMLLFYRKSIFRMAIYYSIIFLLYVPHIVTLLTRFKHSVGGTWLEPPAGAESLYNMIWSFSNAPVVAVFCIVLLVAGLIFTIAQKNFNKTGMLISLWFLIPFLGMFVISFVVPMYISRYLIYSVPAFYLLLVLCIDKFGTNILIKNAVTFLLTAAFLFSATFNPTKNTHITELLNEVKSHKNDNTAVLVCPFDLIDSFSYNYNRSAFSQVSDQQEYLQTINFLRSEKIYFGCEYRTTTQYAELIYVIADERSKSPGQDTVGIASAGFKLDHITQVDDLTKVFYYKKK
jgi:uncharacterized membrane protein